MRLARWVLARLAAFLALLVGTLMLFSLPAMITPRGLSLRGLPMAYQWTPGRWLTVVWFHLSHLARGQILPPLPALVVAITNPLWFTEPFVAVLYLFPFVAVYAVFAASADGTLHVLDPRLGGEIPQARAAPPIWRRLSWPWLSSLHPASLLRRVFRTLREAAGTAPWLWAEWRERLTERLQAWRRAFRDPVLLAGLLLVLALVLVAILAPALAPYAPDRRFLPFQAPDGQIWAPPYGPTPQHLLGVDDLGRDRLSRLIVGTRYALAFAAAVVPAKVLLALSWGWLSASQGGLWSRLLDWFTILLTAIPQILLPLMLIRVFNVALTGNMGAVIAGVLVVALPGIPRLAASFRQQFREVLIQPFLEGAVAVGASPGRILFAHVLPQLRAQLISMAVMEIPLTMTLTATLAYFRTPPGGWIAFQDGGGAPVIPEWGSMLDDPLVLIFAGKWWLWTPFLALVVAVAAFSLLGEGVKRTSGTH